MKFEELFEFNLDNFIIWLYFVIKKKKIGSGMNNFFCMRVKAIILT